MSRTLSLSLCCGVLGWMLTGPAGHAVAQDRVTDGLQAFYTFESAAGGKIRDESGRSAIDLKIETPKTVHASNATLQFQGDGRVSSPAAAKKLIDPIRKTNALSVEVWCTPVNTKQNGPARLLTISKDSVNRNLTVGQDGDKFDVRLRTTKTSANGIPSVASPAKTVTPKLTHVVYTHAADGKTAVYVNGKRVVQKNVGGSLSNWDRNYRLAIGDEISGGRPWRGSVHLVAIYSRALKASDVTQNFGAGPEGKLSPKLIAERKRLAATRHFETAVAPVLAKHCLECHDSASRAGELDLSKKVAAFKGGESGAAIVAGKLDNSELWLSLVDDRMPHERPPLNEKEKQSIKKWIVEGAHWNLDQIDPAVYAHSGSNDGFVQRLTIDEYISTVQSTVGVDIEKEARQFLPADLRADGFSNTAYNLNVDLKHVEAFGRLAEIVVSRMKVVPFVSKFSRKKKFTDNDMGDVISKMGRWVLRGPVSEKEVIAYRGITTTVASAGGNFDEAMGLLLEAMLQSPRFLYRVESQQGDGSEMAVDDFELASRLSYIVWGTSPDEELHKLAGEGDLRAELNAQLDRMLSDPRAIDQSLRFATDWLNLNRLQNLSPNAERFPTWKQELATDMRSETLAYFEAVCWKQNKPLGALLNTQVTFATPRLAKFYGLEAASSDKATPVRMDLTDVDGRGGLLTQGSVLTVGGDDASMVTRGLLVMHELLRGVVKDPPPCVDTTPVPTKPGVTQRSIAMQRIENKSCGGCHAKFEPLAFGLEKFDGLGAYHDKDEHGNELRDDGELLVPGTSASVKYKTAAELMDLLAESDRVSQSFTWKITQFALGRPLVAEDAATVDKIHQQARQSGSTWKAVIKSIVNSDLVLMTKTVSE